MINPTDPIVKYERFALSFAALRRLFRQSKQKTIETDSQENGPLRTLWMKIKDLPSILAIGMHHFSFRLNYFIANSGDAKALWKLVVQLPNREEIIDSGNDLYERICEIKLSNPTDPIVKYESLARSFAVLRYLQNSENQDPFSSTKPIEEDYEEFKKTIERASLGPLYDFWIKIKDHPDLLRFGLISFLQSNFIVHSGRNNRRELKIRRLFLNN